MQISTFLCSIFILLQFTSTGQITIQKGEIKVPSLPVEVYGVTGIPISKPTQGTNKSWNYSSNIPPDIFTIDYVEEVDPFYTSAGIDIYRQRFKNFNANFGYYYYEELDFNNNAVVDKGIYIDNQGYSLQPFTNNNKDSLTFKLQGSILSSSMVLMKFPFSFDSTWASDSRRVVDFNLKIASYGLNNAPAKHIWHRIRKDSIIGWGKLSIYTPQGISKKYDVLMDKITQYTVDSFLLNGVPAPVALLNAFGIKQGQVTNKENRINFYRKESFIYLASLYFGTEKFNTASEIYFDKKNVEKATSALGDVELEFATIVYPNPIRNSIINLQVIGNIPHKIVSYAVNQIDGKSICNGKINESSTNQNFQIELNEQLTPGNYFIQIFNDNGESIISETIVIP